MIMIYTNNDINNGTITIAIELPQKKFTIINIPHCFPIQTTQLVKLIQLNQSRAPAYKTILAKLKEICTNNPKRIKRATRSNPTQHPKIIG